MTKQEIREEKQFCKKRIRLLQKEIMAETSQSIALTKLEEMTALAHRAATLDAMYTKLISDEFDQTVNKLLDNIMERV